MHLIQGDQLKVRVKKICEGFRATLYPCPENPKERGETIVGVKQRLQDLVPFIHSRREQLKDLGFPSFYQ
jgi:V-type H+-transporting ATPase subunit a